MKDRLATGLKKLNTPVFRGVGLVLLGLVIGINLGQYSAPIDKKEVEEIIEVNKFQYLPKDGSLEDALASGHYSHCVVFPGVGLEFGEEKIDGGMVVKQSVRTYPAYNAEILPGSRVTTPLNIIKGDFGSPVKITYVNYLKEKEAILTRTLIKKCLKKSQNQERQFKETY